jgi:hypothetical protein
VKHFVSLTYLTELLVIASPSLTSFAVEKRLGAGRNPFRKDTRWRYLHKRIPACAEALFNSEAGQ